MQPLSADEGISFKQELRKRKPPHGSDLPT